MSEDSPFVKFAYGAGLVLALLFAIALVSHPDAINALIP